MSLVFVSLIKQVNTLGQIEISNYLFTYKPVNFRVCSTKLVKKRKQAMPYSFFALHKMASLQLKLQ